MAKKREEGFLYISQFKLDGQLADWIRNLEKIDPQMSRSHYCRDLIQKDMEKREK